ncbi:MAG: ATP-dependent DNA helicase RecG [Planctomycetaceae bacterium]|nr:ATP-dependent DNA helicase RecG [Planctomycetaceae bacterium]
MNPDEDDSREELLPRLEQQIRFVPGIGPHRAQLLQALGVETVRDLLWLVPRDLIDLTHLSGVNDLTDDRIHTVRGQIVDTDAKAISRGRTLTSAILRTETGLIRGNWFNQPWMLRQLEMNRDCLWTGKPKFRDQRWEIGHPRIQWLDLDEDNSPGKILVRYRLTEGLTQDALRKHVGQVLDYVAGNVADHLPIRLLEHYRLPRLEEAIRNLHQPSSVEAFQAARRRLVFDEQLDFQVGLQLRRRIRRTREKSPVIHVTPQIDARIRLLFPFELTRGQEQAISDVVTDLESSNPMHRLLQADVGAGKTVIAIYAMLAAVAAGYQAVMMAPTELLARQHWETMHELLLHSRVRRCLFTGNLKASERAQLVEQIRTGEMQLICGTQAVIQQDLQYHQLGLAVIDEQHKFGVVQRSRFDSAETTPHVLVMTATPIPRSLCLTQYGDLDLTLMTEQPPGRQPVITSLLLNDKSRHKAWEFITAKLREGRQAYVVCPYINSDNPDAPAGALQVYESLSQNELQDFRVAVLHGQLDRGTQHEIMARFREREIDVLVATTVLEVGVDVPNATMMVIEDAQQFGMSQLHQLRGRIGRGAFRGYCFLMSSSTNEDSLERLRAIERYASGFDVAEADFALRGPGNILGTEQHGSQPFRVTRFDRDEAILKETSRAAERMVEKGTIDEPDFAPLKLRVIERFGNQLDLTRTG